METSSPPLFLRRHGYGHPRPYLAQHLLRHSNPNAALPPYPPPGQPACLPQAPFKPARVEEEEKEREGAGSHHSDTARPSSLAVAVTGELSYIFFVFLCVCAETFPHVRAELSISKKGNNVKSVAFMLC